MKLDDIIKENIIKPYSVIADIYNKRHFIEPDFKKPIKDFLGLVKKKGKILDAGCGPGGESKAFVDMGYHVVGIDITPKMIRIAMKNVPDVKFLKMDVRKLKFKDKTFDGIWSARTLIHIPSQEVVSTLKEWGRVLKNKGVLCVCVLKGNKEKIEPEYYDQTGKTKTFFHYFSQGEIENLIAQAGFKLLKSYTIHVGKEKEAHIFTFGLKEKS